MAKAPTTRPPAKRAGTSKRPKARGDRNAPLKALNDRHRVFVAELLIDDNAARAYEAAGFTARGNSAEVNAMRLKRQPLIIELLAAERAARSERLQVKADDVLSMWWTIATANPNELIEYRRGACRYCYGAGHLYQRTPREYAHAMDEWARATKKQKDDEEAQPFNEMGGVGYDRRKPAHPDCPECFGEGVEYTFAHDTRHASASARRLYAGVKETKDGLEIKMHDPVAASQMVARHLGMFVEKHEHAGKDGGPIQHAEVTFYMPSNGRRAR